MSRSLSQEESSALLRQQALDDRLSPQPGAKLYLHLSDLRLALGKVATDTPLRLLDFGCGGSPYRALFPRADYQRADLAGMSEVDFIIEPGKPLAAPDASFDVVLSTQVFEHVEDPAAYLRECQRLLKPGGKLVLSTHGTFPDHGAPWDFQRWTPHGLARDLKTAGFEIDIIWRLTSGPRAVLQLWELNMERLRCDHGTFGFLFRALRWITRRQRTRFHSWADQRLGDYRLADGADDPAHRLYLGLMIVATNKLPS
jgi:SAM-dependent methyltransferase